MTITPIPKPISLIYSSTEYKESFQQSLSQQQNSEKETKQVDHKKHQYKLKYLQN
jgi:hypothetical protein